MLQGDSNPWRDIGFAQWYDPYASYEDPSSKEFQESVDTENKSFKMHISPYLHKVAALQKEFAEDAALVIPDDPSAAQEIATWRGRAVYIQHVPGHRLRVWISDGSKVLRNFSDLESFGFDPDSDFYFTIKDIGNGDQTLQLSVYEYGVYSPQYKIDGVGPNAAFKDDSLYYIETEKGNQLHSNAVYRVDKTNGRYRSKLYEIKDARYNVLLFAPPRQRDLFVRIENALSQRIGILEKGSVKWMSPLQQGDGHGTTLAPIAEDIYASNNELHVKGLVYAFPKHSYFSDAVLLDAHNILVATVKNGITNLYLFEMEEKIYKLLYESKAPNAIMLHRYSTIPSFTATSYYSSNAIYEIHDGRISLVRKAAEPLHFVKYSFGEARAYDGTEIPYTFVSTVKNPKKLLVSAYGAYGISSLRTYPNRWLPFLRRGYAFVEAAPRGGRENGDAWYDSARTALRKHTTFDDTAAVIKAVQEKYKFKKENTILYGRSAGGWTAAYIGLKYSNLVGAVYAEVPYLDVLRTTSNPKLPLTQLEYDEFGNPIERPEEYAALQQISPVDIVPAASVDAPFFLIRTALYDSQVLPYESLKFAAKLKGLGWNAILGIDSDGGHFTKSENMYKIHAEDFAILDAHIKPRRMQKTRRQARTKLRSQRSMGTIRRKRSSLKH